MADAELGTPSKRPRVDSTNETDDEA